MSEKTAIVCADGCGGSLLGQQCAHFARQKGDDVTVFYAADDAKFRVIKHLFPETKQLPEEFQHNNNFEQDFNYKLNLFNKHGRFDNVYYVVPDLTFSNKHAFDYKKYGVGLQAIKSARLLTNQWAPTKQVYCALNTTTPNYDYKHSAALVRALAEKLPDYTIYVPIVNQWAGHEIVHGYYGQFPDNVLFHSNPDFIESIEYLKKSEYCICLDNGISHFAFHLGVSRLVLDYRLGHVAWEARWRQTMEDSVPIDMTPELVADIVKLNIEIPQTQLIDRKYLIGGGGADWKQILLIKEI